MIKKANTEGISIRIGLFFSKFGLSPNAWTVLALLPAFMGLISLIYLNLPLALILFVISGFIDAIDGGVARVTGRATNKGAFLDGIVDRYVEIIIYSGLLFYVLNTQIEAFLVPHAFWFMILLFGALMTTYSRAYADHKNVVTEPKDHKRMAGLVERPERLTLIYAGMLLEYFQPGSLIYVIAFAAILSNLTALQRIIFVLRFKQ